MHIIFKLQHIKEKVKLFLKARGYRHLTFKGTRLKITQTMQARKEWSKIFELLKEKQTDTR